MARGIDLLGGRVRIDTEELLAQGRVEARDLVVLSGTLLEGIGNLYSDLDLYVIGEQLPPKGPDGPAMQVVREDGRVRRINETLVNAGNILLDVQYYTFRELATLARSLNELYSESRQSTRIFRKTLHPDDEDLIHKLLTGVVLQEGAVRFNADEVFDSAKFCFLKFRNEMGGYAEFRDLVGSWTDGDLDSCLYNIRSYLIAQVSGLMFLAGKTNPRPKWFVRKLGSLGDEYAELRARIMGWLEGSHHTEVQKRQSIQNACGLIDATYELVRSLLDTRPQYFRVQEALSLTESAFAEQATHDREMSDEFQLLRRIFSSSVPPLFSQIDAHTRKRPGVAA